MTLDPVARMLRCLRAARALQTYLDGEADDLSAGQVAAHLRECRRCVREVEAYRAIKRVLNRTAGASDQLAVRRLQAFGRALAEPNPPGA